jgi:hypothetical protein
VAAHGRHRDRLRARGPQSPDQRQERRGLGVSAVLPEVRDQVARIGMRNGQLEATARRRVPFDQAAIV